MSKSDPNSAIFMEDTEQEVKTKIKKAFCPPQQVGAWWGWGAGVLGGSPAGIQGDLLPPQQARAGVMGGAAA